MAVLGLRGRRFLLGRGLVGRLRLLLWLSLLIGTGSGLSGLLSLSGLRERLRRRGSPRHSVVVRGRCQAQHTEQGVSLAVTLRGAHGLDRVLTARRVIRKRQARLFAVAVAVGHNTGRGHKARLRLFCTPGMAQAALVHENLNLLQGAGQAGMAVADIATLGRVPHGLILDDLRALLPELGHGLGVRHFCLPVQDALLCVQNHIDLVRGHVRVRRQALHGLDHCKDRIIDGLCQGARLLLLYEFCCYCFIVHGSPLDAFD